MQRWDILAGQLSHFRAGKMAVSFANNIAIL
jgi:hypothetical protein